MKSRRKIQGKYLTKKVGCVYNPSLGSVINFVFMGINGFFLEMN